MIVIPRCPDSSPPVGVKMLLRGRRLRHTWRWFLSRYAMNASAELLNELRIERNAPPPSASSAKWWALAAIAVAIVAVIVWLISQRETAIDAR